MKISRIIRTVVSVLLMLSVAFIITTAISPAENALAADTGSTANTITVTGTGTVYAEPDTATIYLGVETRNKDASKAQSENAAAMQAVISAVAASGVAKQDIATSGYNIYTDYSYSNDGRNVNGYVVSNSVTVIVRDITKLGAIIDAAGKSGANNMGGINFSVSNYDKFYSDALKQAVAQAKSKGGVIASAIGVTIGSPSSIVEGAQYYAPSMSMVAPVADSAAGAKTPVELGRSAITANVTVTYKY